MRDSSLAPVLHGGSIRRRRGGTEDLELVTGNPGIGGTTMGDINRLIEWHFALRRIRSSGDETKLFTTTTSTTATRSSISRNMHGRYSSIRRMIAASRSMACRSIWMAAHAECGFRRVFKNSAVPAAQSFTLNKTGMDGTYFEVTASGLATSSISGRYNAFRTNQTDSKSVSVGLNTSTTTVGLRSGTVTVNNLDVTTAGGGGRGSFDADDTFNVNLTVLDHATPSFASATTQSELAPRFRHRDDCGRAAESVPSTCSTTVQRPSSRPTWTSMR